MTENGWKSMSDEIGELATALAQAQAEIAPAIKDSENPFLKNKFADLNSVCNVVRPAMRKNGLAWPQLLDNIDGTDYLVTMLLHTSGQWIRSRMKLTCEASKGVNENQAMGIAITYARRYSLTAMAGVMQEDNDAATAAPSEDYVKRNDELSRRRKLSAVLAKLKKRWPDETAEYCADLLQDKGDLKAIEHAKGEDCEAMIEQLTRFGLLMQEENRQKDEIEEEVLADA
tara:strand:+ start:6898 stop:7584 length:687 start_codon:yes stop_codon:yes gene_type:complete